MEQLHSLYYLTLFYIFFNKIKDASQNFAV